MKKLSKKKSIVVLSIIVAVILVGAVFAFIPMHFGTSDYAGFLGNVSVSNDLRSGMYAEYEITSVSTDEEVDVAIHKIKDILSIEGYVNSNVYKKGEDTLRIEIRGAKNSEEENNAQTILEGFTGGLFEIRAGNDESVINVLDGSKHVKDVSVKSSGAYYVVIVNMNKEGTKLYESLTRESIDSYSSKVYMYMNDNAWPNSSYNSLSIQDVTTNGQLALSFETLDAANYYARAIRCGTIGVELDKDSMKVAGMSPTLGEHTLLVVVIAFSIAILAIIVLCVVKYKLHAVAVILALIVDCIVSLFFLQAMPWVELDLASIIAVYAMYAFIIVNFMHIANVTTEEHRLGKAPEACFAVGDEKAVKYVCDFSIIPFVFGLIVAVVATQSLQTIGIVLVMFGVLNALSNLLLVPIFRKLFVNIWGDNAKLYGMKEEVAQNESK